MNRCLSCGEKTEKKESFHKTCLKKLFGVSYLPALNISLREVSIKAQKMAGKLSISGVHPKLSMKLNRKNKEMEVVAEGGEYILKPSVEIFPNLPQNENLCMTIASKLGIETPPHCLIKLKDGSWAYIVKRFDRVNNKKLHQEDFLQILGKENKYQGSLEEVGKKLRQISEFPGLDVQLFFERVVFFFIIGNGDAHLKNFSGTYNEYGRIRLSPAYDIVSSKLIIPDEEDFALSMNGKKNKITGKDFSIFSTYLRIPDRIGNRKFLDKKKVIGDLIKDSLLDNDEKKRLSDIVHKRFSMLGPSGK